MPEVEHGCAGHPNSRATGAVRCPGPGPRPLATPGSAPPAGMAAPTADPCGERGYATGSGSAPARWRGAISPPTPDHRAPEGRTPPHPASTSDCVHAAGPHHPPGTPSLTPFRVTKISRLPPLPVATRARSRASPTRGPKHRSRYPAAAFISRAVPTASARRVRRRCPRQQSRTRSVTTCLLPVHSPGELAVDSEQHPPAPEVSPAPDLNQEPPDYKAGAIRLIWPLPATMVTPPSPTDASRHMSSLHFASRMMSRLPSPQRGRTGGCTPHRGSWGEDGEVLDGLLSGVDQPLGRGQIGEHGIGVDPGISVGVLAGMAGGPDPVDGSQQAPQ